MRILTLIVGWHGIAASLFITLFQFSVFASQPSYAGEIFNKKEIIFFAIYFAVNFSVIGLVLISRKKLFADIKTFCIIVGISLIFGGIIPLFTLEKDLSLGFESFVMLLPSFFYTGGLVMLFIGNHYQRLQTYNESLKMSSTSTPTPKDISS